jgi:TM2 domain-containing membrane protein YozV
VMSFFVPGTGQFYNGQWIKGAVHVAVAGASAAWTVFRIGPYKEHMRTEMYVGAAVYGLNLVLATVDAPLSAIRLNRAHGYAGFKRQLDVRQATLALSATDGGRGVGVGFRIGL